MTRLLHPDNESFCFGGLCSHAARCHFLSSVMYDADMARVNPAHFSRCNLFIWQGFAVGLLLF